ncbi:MAG: hypothetical protein U0573_15190 [Phycisphaerales bacterium]|nr:hypothetical protein [Planctomycetota bacterium]
MRRRAVIAALGLLAAGCQTKVVRYNPPLAGLPGAQTGVQPVLDPSIKVADSTLTKQASAEPIITNPDGSKTLISRNGQDLMFHIARTMRDDDEKLFTEQVLSELTKDEFYERGYNPNLAFREIKRRHEDVEKLFKVLPAGELTPGVLLEQVGPNIMRVRVHYHDPADLPWCGFDMRLEGPNWKLRWFVVNDGK